LAEAATTEQAQQIMDTNFFGSVRVNRAVLPYMRRQQSGLLLHISSGAGRLVISSMGFCCASKFAMESLAEAYHYELAAQGIESSIVEPGAYQTPVFGNIVRAADQPAPRRTGRPIRLQPRSVAYSRARPEMPRRSPMRCWGLWTLPLGRGSCGIASVRRASA
jgi:NAD(P)-dependent dehydrogenase (short-subunit alcohol dehydrogenase family)